MLEQYWVLKREVPDAILLYRLGDFYEMFFEDAEVAAPLLGLVLTARHRDSDIEAPMCGVPHHALDPTSPGSSPRGGRSRSASRWRRRRRAKALVARRIIRVVTPGTLVDPDRLDARQANDLAAVALGSARGGAGVPRSLDRATSRRSGSTGRPRRRAAGVAGLRRARLLPVGRGTVAGCARVARRPTRRPRPALRSDSPRGRAAAELLERHFGTATLDPFGLPPAGPGGRRGGGGPPLRADDPEGRLRSRRAP